MTLTENQIALEPLKETGHEVSQHLLGVNLELAPANAASLVNNRIRNSKFGGPADAQTGIVSEWQPFGSNMGGMHARVLEGMFYSPSQCQMLHNYSQPYGAGLVQTGIPIRAGEKLTFRLWAKVRHRPVKILISLRAQASRDEDGYANAEIVVDSAYWKCFEAEFSIAASDENAVLFLLLLDTGVLLLDQAILGLSGEGEVNRDTEEAILRLNPPAIRFPGGCLSTNHHWRFGTGPRELRPSLADPVFKLRTDYDFGTDEYLELCRTLRSAPHITVNIGSGTPRDAAEWARYCADWFRARGGEPPLAYFQMGNEQYGSWETSHMNAEMYVEALRSFVPGVREAYPNCRILALAEPFASGVAGEPETALRQAVLNEAQGLFDVLAINRYKGQWFDDPAEQLRNAVDSVGKIEADLQTLADDCRRAGWTPRLALTEWNYWLHAAHWDGHGFLEPDDALHAVFFAGVIHALARLGDVVELASYYHLLNAMGLIRETKGRIGETALGAIFRLYRSALPGRLVPLPADFDPDIDALAVRHGATTSLFLLVRATGPARTIRLGEAFGKPESSQMLAAPDCYAPMKPCEVCLIKGEVELPALSLTKIDFS